MNRTLKFQLSNVKISLFYSAVVTYVIAAVLIGFNFFLEGDLLQEIVSYPVWLVIFSIVAAPFLIFPLFFAISEGSSFFDSSIRLGISRNTYFMTQMVTYILITIFSAFVTGISETAWNGSAGSYFVSIGSNFLSVEHLLVEFFRILFFATVALAAYRYKFKVVIPLFVLIGIAPILFSIVTSMDNPVLIEALLKMVVGLLESPWIAAGIGSVFVVLLYYFLVTTTEVQD